MNKNIKLFIGILVAILVAGASLAYGALTAEQPKPAAIQTPDNKQPLAAQLETEQATIDTVLIAAYPKIQTDYLVNKGQLYGEKGEWYGTTLTYKGADVANRDTLRLLMQKKDGIWIVRTAPPEPLLSAKKYSVVPVSILKSINKPIGLPAGAANSPAVNPAG